MLLITLLRWQRMLSDRIGVFRSCTMELLIISTSSDPDTSSMGIMGINTSGDPDITLRDTCSLCS